MISLQPLRNIRVLGLLALLSNACGTMPGAAEDGSPPSVADSAAAIRADELPIRMDAKQIVAGTFTQEIDHPYQPGASLGQFQQRYWYTTQFAKDASSPVIFYLCGEAACSPWYALTMADTAKALGAAVVVLEHRYY